MSSDVENSRVVTETVRVVTELAKVVPIYPDAIQPAAKEVGKSLHLVARAVNAALTPVEALVWGIEQIRDFVRERVSKKLEGVPPDDVQQPKAYIAVPAIEALRYIGKESDLSELYANLLATSMDKVTAYRAHPAFVEIIKNMSPDDARIMRFLETNTSQPLINIKAREKGGVGFSIIHRHISLIGLKAGCDHPELSANYLDNLERLGLVEISGFKRKKDDAFYKEIEEYDQVAEILENLRKFQTHTIETEKIMLELTALGKQFVRSCVIDKSIQDRS